METRREWESSQGASRTSEEDEPDDLHPDVLDSDVDNLNVDALDLSEDVGGEEGARSNGARGLALAAFTGLTLGAAAFGRIETRTSSRVWYRTLRKPPFQPPSWVFGPVWSALYALIASSGYRVWKAPPSKSRNAALALWGTQLALNAAWAPLFFGARRKRAAFVDLLALLGAVTAYASVSRKVDKPAAAMVLPYLGWLGFAGLLNEELIRRNSGWRRWIGR
jgi:translocator protein